jgi:hypothetical protein
MNNESGLPRAVQEGESVILSTGATATLRRSYPAGYDGDVEIELDGVEESDRASALTLTDPVPDAQLNNETASLGDAAAAQTAGESRAPSRRMED